MISHAGTDLLPDDVAAFEESLNAHLPAEHHHVARPRDVVAGFFDGLQLVDPGVVRVSEWRPDSPGGGRHPDDPVGRRRPKALTRPPVPAARGALPAYGGAAAH